MMHLHADDVKEIALARVGAVRAGRHLGAGAQGRACACSHPSQLLDGLCLRRISTHPSQPLDMLQALLENGAFYLDTSYIAFYSDASYAAFYLYTSYIARRQLLATLHTYNCLQH
jgi:hypothetical protein